MKSLNLLEYNGYHAKIEYSQEDEVLFGTILGIDDLITFEAENAHDIKQSFREAVDEYLQACEANGKNPQKEYSGCFNVRVPSAMHKALAEEAMKNGVTLNELVKGIFREHYDKKALVVQVVQEYTDIEDPLTYNFQNQSIAAQGLKYRTMWS